MSKTFNPCICCCSSNCDSDDCGVCDPESLCSSDGTGVLDVCVRRDRDLPWIGCSKSTPPPKAFYDNDSSGEFTVVVGACLTAGGEPCEDEYGFALLNIRDGVFPYWSVHIKNDTTSCITLRQYFTVSGLAEGCSLEVSLVQIDSDEWDCEFAFPGTYANGTHVYNAHCGNKCQDEVDFCFAARVVGPCFPCKTAEVTISNFKWDVRCPDEEDCTGIDDGCADYYDCLECCECCTVTDVEVSAEDGLSRYDTDILCCGSSYYILDSSYYACSVSSTGECTPPTSRCDDTGPDSYILDCANNPSSECVLSRTILSDFLYYYPCDCGYTTPPPETTCTPGANGIVYKGTDEDCSNLTEPCNGLSGPCPS